jgi:hypothetical protein
VCATAKVNYHPLMVGKKYDDSVTTIQRQPLAGGNFLPPLYKQYLRSRGCGQ